MTKDPQKIAKARFRDVTQIAEFTFEDVVAAVGAPATTVRSYMRNAIQMRKDSGDRPGVRGRSSLYTSRRLMQVAIVHKLAALGISPKIAAEAALSFSDFAAETYDGQTSYDDPREVPRRKPGHLFPGDSIRTILWIVGVEHGEPVTRLLAVLLGQPIGGDQFNTGSYTAGLFVDVTALADQIEDRLGVPIVGRG